MPETTQHIRVGESLLELDVLVRTAEAGFGLPVHFGADREFPVCSHAVYRKVIDLVPEDRVKSEFGASVPKALSVRTALQLLALQRPQPGHRRRVGTVVGERLRTNQARRYRESVVAAPVL